MTDAEYYAERARAERDLAGRAADRKVRDIHLDMALSYDKLARSKSPARRLASYKARASSERLSQSA